MKEKTVFVLGAGFSAGVKNEYGVRVPSQEKLVEQIILHRGQFPAEFTKFQDFLVNVMAIPEHYHATIPLEDIFTPLDKCITEGISFRNINSDKAREIRELVNYLIGKTLDIILRGDIQKDYIDSFAKHVSDLCSIRANGNYSKSDPVSIITTNWDILLDNSIKDYLDAIYNIGGDLKAVVDYCCHISSYDPNNHKIKPGLEVMGKGGFNVKLLKLHGSLNWLQCPRCNRLFVDFDNKIAVGQYIYKETCRHCNNNFGVHDSHILVSNLIMPTFLKNLTNTQYKLIWHNAAIELSEATKIVFIGYSLPAADFEMKQILSRMVRNTAEIEVIDLGISETDAKIVDLKNRYEVFFGREVIIHFQGTEEYIYNHLS